MEQVEPVVLAVVETLTLRLTETEVLQQPILAVVVVVLVLLIPAVTVVRV
jgi:hypothetical protein